MLALLWVAALSFIACDQNPEPEADRQSLADSTQVAASQTRQLRVITGAERLLSTEANRLRGRRLGLVANPTTRLPDGPHLVDTLLAAGYDLVRVFAPEHGFRGQADAGEQVDNTTDPDTGLPIISLYGANKKPQARYLDDLDLLIFDLQDVGSRHYTYISTLTNVMEACAETNLPLLVLDRPNPNGWYVEGPVLEAGNESFIGMHPVPIVHGLTLGEYALMVNGEGWLERDRQASLEVIPCQGYRHDMRWVQTGLPWVAPSPNLASAQAATLYPALCWFEPTSMSVGRGTEEAFTLLGAPWLDPRTFFPGQTTARMRHFGLDIDTVNFTPVSLPGKATKPKFQDKTCHGLQFGGETSGRELFLLGLHLLQVCEQQHMLTMQSGDFFQRGFNRWAGNRSLQTQVKDGQSPEDIWQSWQDDLDAFKQGRKAYLLYPEQ